MGGRAACHGRTHSSARVSKRQLSPLPPVRLPTGQTRAPRTAPVLVATSCPRGPASPRSPKTVAPSSAGNTCQWLRKELLQNEQRQPHGGIALHIDLTRPTKAVGTRGIRGFSRGHERIGTRSQPRSWTSATGVVRPRMHPASSRWIGLINFLVQLCFHSITLQIHNSWHPRWAYQFRISRLNPRATRTDSRLCSISAPCERLNMSACYQRGLRAQRASCSNIVATVLAGSMRPRCPLLPSSCSISHHAVLHHLKALSVTVLEHPRTV